MRNIVYLLIFSCLIVFNINDLNSQSKRRRKSTKLKKDRYIDLEGLDIQGIIDRPGTLYILKKSKVEFSEKLKKYDYLKEIVNSTYNEPF